MKAVVLVDTREKDLHILRDLDKIQVPWRRKKLNYGDYSFEWNGKSYENEIVIERKGSIDEIVSNFTIGRKRFKNEFERSKGCKVIIMVEASKEALNNHEYRSKMSPKDLESFIKTWCYKFQLDFNFVEKEKACNFMIKKFNYYLIQAK